MMNIEKYDLDKLRKLYRNLEKENESLKKLLKQANISFEETDIFQEDIVNDEYDLDQADRIIEREINEDLVRRFFGMFYGRLDVFAKRSKNGSYYTQCDNRWNIVCPKQNDSRFPCDKCEHRKWTRIDGNKLIKHLKGTKDDGTDVIGIYPLHEDGTCRLIVFDFDNHEKGNEENDFANKNHKWKTEVDALRKICLLNGITPLVERSRSGKGAHLWIFFAQPIQATLARNFAFLLLDKGLLSINVTSFDYYDRLYPTQDFSNSIGNLIALPLQGDAVKKGNSVFVDENWNAYPDQWDILFNKTRKLKLSDVQTYMAKWQAELAEEKGKLVEFSLAERVKPWKKNERFIKEDVIGKLHIVLADGIYVDTLNIMPRLQNQIRSLAAIDNPIFYKNKKLGYSNYCNFSSIYLGKDENGYIKIPRGLKEKIIEECEKGKLDYEIEDRREVGRPIRVDFQGDLKIKQNLAADEMFNYDNGVLNAATGFGKTVLCSYFISKRKVSTLIILQNKELINQWIDELNKFLNIREKSPKYTTKTGIIKKRESKIGILHGSKNTLTGIIDIAMIGSLCNKENIDDIISKYGMIIIDECHHSASNTYVEVLKRVKSKYVYGVSATLKRSDNLDKIIYMMIGPIRHTYTAKQKAEDSGIKHYLIPRFTKVVDIRENKEDINEAYNMVCFNKLRNQQIVFDVIECISIGLSPVILTKYKKHAELLYEELVGKADHVYILYGENTDKENRIIRAKLNKVAKDETLILIATGQKIGEGFNLPKLDTLILASPISSAGRVEQFVGRIDRTYEGKEKVFVYDYVDSHVTVFNNMYKKRLKTYKKTAYEIYQDQIKEKQFAKSIFDSGNYIETFEKDLIEADNRIIVSSPTIARDKIERFIDIVKTKQEYGVEITIITNDPDSSPFLDADISYELISKLKSNGINVILKEETNECFAIFDDELLWHGGANLLGKEDVYDNLIRLRNKESVAELLEIALCQQGNN